MTNAARSAQHHAALAEALDALAAGDHALALARLDALHEQAHMDPVVHRLVHVWTLRVHRARGEWRAALGELLPIAFAPTVARVERLLGRRNRLFAPRGTP